MILLFSTMLVFSACAFQIGTQMASARQSLMDARFAGAPERCPELYRKAAEHLRLAEEALAAGDMETALVQAQNAQLAALRAKNCNEEEYLSPGGKRVPPRKKQDYEIKRF